MVRTATKNVFLFIVLFFYASFIRAETSLFSLSGEGLIIDIGIRTESRAVFRITSSNVLNAKYFLLKSPLRLVIDLEGKHSLRTQGQNLSENRFFKAIRLGRHINKTRFVLDLKQAILVQQKLNQKTYLLEIALVESGQEQVSPKIDNTDIEPKNSEELTSPVQRPQFSLSKVIMYHKPDERPVRNIVVKSYSSEPILITTTAKKILRAGFEDEQRIKSQELFVSPQRFVLKANQQRTVRLVLNLKSRAVEQVYRVSFLPQFVDQEQLELVSWKKKVVKLVTGLGALVIAEVPDAKPKITWSREGSKTTIKNEGTTNVFLDNGKICSDNFPRCLSLPSKRLYVGNMLELGIPSNSEISYRAKIGRDGYEFLTITKDE